MKLFFSKKSDIVLKILLTIFLAFLLWNILFFFPTVFILYESDAAFPGLIWYGLKEYGWEFIPSVIYGKANWLFSIISIHFIFFSLFTPSLNLIFTVGWLIFTLNAFFSTFLIKKALNIPFYSNFILILLIIFLTVDYGNFTAYGFYYPVTHNSTFTWVLGALIITIYLLNLSTFKENIVKFYLLLITAISATIGFSDAWFHAVYSLPAIISLILVGFIYKHKNLLLRIGFLILSITLGWFLSYTKFFGLLDFVTTSSFSFVNSLDQFEKNLSIYLYSILSYFGLLQAFKVSSFLGIFMISTFITMLLLSIIFFKKQLKNFIVESNISQDFSPTFLIIFFLMSIVSISLSFILYRHVIDMVSSRYLINIYYFMFSLFILMGAKMNKDFPGKIFRYFLVSFLILYLSLIFKENSPFFKRFIQEIKVDFNTALNILPILNNYSDWIIANLKNKNYDENFKSVFLSRERLGELLNLLKKENLKLGYGFYWEAYPNVIIMETKGNIKMGAIYPNLNIRGQTSSFFFRKSKITEETNFIIIPKFKLVSAEYFNSFPKEKMMDLAEIFFGKPERVIESKHYKVLIWNYKIYAKRPESLMRHVIEGVKAYLIDGNDVEDLSFETLIKGGYISNLLGYSFEDSRWSKVGNLWVGNWECKKGKCIGIGIVDYIDNLEEVINMFKDRAVEIYFPYPKPYSGREPSEEFGQLLIILRVEDVLHGTSKRRPPPPEPPPGL